MKPNKRKKAQENAKKREKGTEEGGPFPLGGEQLKNKRGW